MLLLPHTNAEAATVLAERLRDQVSADPIMLDSRELTITISVGGAAAEGPGEHQLLALADQELYAAKDHGRNRVRVVRSEG